MPRYVLLVDWTEEGVRAVEHSVDRLEQGTKLGERFGCTVEHAWWTQGGHDMVSVINAPDEESMAAYTLAVVRLGNLRTTTLRALDRGRDAGNLWPATAVAPDGRRFENRAEPRVAL